MSNLYEYIKMAVHNIMANKGRSFLTMLGIIIGIASVIAIVSVGEGTKNQMNSEIDDIGGGLDLLHHSGDLPGKDAAGLDVSVDRRASERADAELGDRLRGGVRRVFLRYEFAAEFVLYAAAGVSAEASSGRDGRDIRRVENHLLVILMNSALRLR